MTSRAAANKIGSCLAEHTLKRPGINGFHYYLLWAWSWITQPRDCHVDDWFQIRDTPAGANTGLQGHTKHILKTLHEDGHLHFESSTMFGCSMTEGVVKDVVRPPEPALQIYRAVTGDMIADADTQEQQYVNIYNWLLRNGRHKQWEGKTTDIYHERGTRYARRLLKEMEQQGWIRITTSGHRLQIKLVRRKSRAKKSTRFYEYDFVNQQLSKLLKDICLEEIEWDRADTLQRIEWHKKYPDIFWANKIKPHKIHHIFGGYK